MYYNLDLDKVRVREDKVGSIISSHLKEKYPVVVKVECVTEFFHWNNPKFHFFIDVDYSRQDGPDSFYNRLIKKEVYNLCKYILGDRESVGSVSCNSVIHVPV
jgi:hypothetical protein